MLVEGSRTTSDETRKALTFATAAGRERRASRARRSLMRTENPSVSPRAPYRETLLPSKMGDVFGDGSSRASRVESPSTCTAGAASQAAIDDSRLARE